MFTLVRLSSAVLLAVFSYFAAQAYQPLYDPDMNSPAFVARMTMFGAVVGWLFLGRHAGRKLWLSAYMGVQAVALTAILVALVFGVREVFILGYRRRISEPVDAILAIPEQALNFLLIAMERDFLLLLGGGGVLLGMLVHLVARTTDRRRLQR